MRTHRTPTAQDSKAGFLRLRFPEVHMARMDDNAIVNGTAVDLTYVAGRATIPIDVRSPQVPKSRTSVPILFPPSSAQNHTSPKAWGSIRDHHLWRDGEILVALLYSHLTGRYDELGLR